MFCSFLFTRGCKTICMKRQLREVEIPLFQNKFISNIPRLDCLQIPAPTPAVWRTVAHQSEMNIHITCDTQEALALMKRLHVGGLVEREA